MRGMDRKDYARGGMSITQQRRRHERQSRRTVRNAIFNVIYVTVSLKFLHHKGWENVEPSEGPSAGIVTGETLNPGSRTMKAYACTLPSSPK